MKSSLPAVYTLIVPDIVAVLLLPVNVKTWSSSIVWAALKVRFNEEIPSIKGSELELSIPIPLTILLANLRVIPSANVCVFSRVITFVVEFTLVI